MFVLDSLLLAGCSQPEADAIFGRGGESQSIDVPQGRLKAEIYTTTHLSARPTLVVVLHGDLFNPTPSYQYAFAQALTPRIRRASHAGQSAREAGKASRGE